jgi:hypothetical protein
MMSHDPQTLEGSISHIPNQRCLSHLRTRFRRLNKHIPTTYAFLNTNNIWLSWSQAPATVNLSQCKSNLNQSKSILRSDVSPVLHHSFSRRSSASSLQFLNIITFPPWFGGVSSTNISVPRLISPMSTSSSALSSVSAFAFFLRFPPLGTLLRSPSV